jgi:phospholipid transport system substrate-binding protein
MNRRTLLALLLLAALAPVARAADPEAARATIVQTVDEVLAVLDEKGLSTDARISKLESIADRRFAWDLMARLVLARNWPKLSEQQRAEFQTEFRRHLRLSYGRRIETYSGEKIEVGDARGEPNGDVTVMTTIRGGRFEGTRVDYRMRTKSSDWQVLDVIIEGVSLISNFRTQIQEIVSSRGVEQLIDELRAKGPTDLEPKPKPGS